MLTIKKRQRYLKVLGFYTGKVNGIWNEECDAAILSIQKKYFPERYQDGKYGEKTDILLRSAYNCRDLNYFKLQEFKCGCKGKYCTGYPVVLNRKFVVKLDKTLRPKYGAMIITSALRCKTHNANVGGVANSVHTKGKAIDWVGEATSTYNKRVSVINYCKTKFKYSYGNTSGMGNAVHVND